MAAVKRQLDALRFRRAGSRTCRRSISPAKLDAALAPDPLGKVLFDPGGTLAIGMALKLARLATGRHKTLSLWDSFHGASLDAISIGGEALFRKGIGPLLPGTEHAPPCDPRTCQFGCGGTCTAQCAEYLDYVLGKEEDVGAVIIETVRCTDVQIPPPDYYRIVRDACDRHGALLILDEVPICLGRTGRMFAFEHYGIVPDMVVLGKGLGGAVFPMAALIARRDLDVAADRALGHYTHEKSSVEAPPRLRRSKSSTTKACSSAHRRWESRRLRECAPCSSGTRWLPRTCAASACCSGSSSPEMARRRGAKRNRRCITVAHGLLFKVGQGNVLTLSPPLVITAAELDAAFDIVDGALSAVAAGTD